LSGTAPAPQYVRGRRHFLVGGRGGIELYRHMYRHTCGGPDRRALYRHPWAALAPLARAILAASTVFLCTGVPRGGTCGARVGWHERTCPPLIMQPALVPANIEHRRGAEAENRKIGAENRSIMVCSFTNFYCTNNPTKNFFPSRGNSWGENPPDPPTVHFPVKGPQRLLSDVECHKKYRLLVDVECHKKYIQLPRLGGYAGAGDGGAPARRTATAT